MDARLKMEVEIKKRSSYGSFPRELIRLMCCKLWISESRNLAALESVEEATKIRGESVTVVNRFLDPAYNRVVYTLVSHLNTSGAGAGDISASPLMETVSAMVEAAYAGIDLRRHSGTHPRFGVVDHICFHPLAGADLDQAAQLAKLLSSAVGHRFQVPVFLFEAAHPRGKPLDAVRRELGYYQPNYMGVQWSGWALPELLPELPDEGPARVNPEKGMVAIGASPWIDNYNIPLLSSDVSTAKRIARLVSARGGGLPGVQALALVHGEESVEVACCIREPNRVGAERVRREVERLAGEEGLQVGRSYFTDLSQEMIVDEFLRSVAPATLFVLHPSNPINEDNLHGLTSAPDLDLALMHSCSNSNYNLRIINGRMSA